MKSLILGGVKSGKSRYAEALADAGQLPVCLIATATANDAEMAERIRQHQLDRNPQWRLVETAINLGDSIADTPSDTCLVIDCLTLWITNLLMTEDEALFSDQMSRFMDAFTHRNGTTIVVSNETNMGIIPMGSLSRRYCDEMGRLHQQLAASSDEVVLMVAGLPHKLKPASSDQR